MTVKLTADDIADLHDAHAAALLRYLARRTLEPEADLRAAATRADGLTRRPASWRQRPRLRPSAALVVAALAIVAGVLLVANPGDSRLDPVAQARPALDTEDAETEGGGPIDIRQDPIAGSEDPTVALRRLFDSDRFQPGSERRRDGRLVRDLVASEPGRRFENGAIRPDARTVYTVDAESRRDPSVQTAPGRGHR